MLIKVLDILIGFVSQVINSFGYSGIVMLMAIESACIPLPSEIIMPFSGFVVSQGKMNIYLVSLAGAFGNLIGSVVAYALGSFGGRPLLLKYGKYILVRKHDIELAEGFFTKYGWAAVFFGRLLPVVRTYISLPAGIARMNFLLFCLLTFLGALPWSYALAYAGFMLGRNWEDIRTYTHIIDIAVILGLLVLIIYFVHRKRKKSV